MHVAFDFTSSFDVILFTCIMLTSNNRRCGSMAWAFPEYSKEQVNSAANLILDEFYAPPDKFVMRNENELDDAFDVVNNWRACHGFPLNTFQMNLRRASRRFDFNPLVAQRTKRLSSVFHKLDRFRTMKLTQMQDIGGCRAVLNDVGAVEKLSDYYRNESQIKHKFLTCDDYVESPKGSGYRGVHLVYRYYSDKKKVYNDLKIEIQLRSLYQHAWATAVETVGTFVREALKSSWGPENWLRFFALMGSAIAFRENRPLVPGTPTERAVLAEELKHYVATLNVTQRLQAYGSALRKVQQDTSQHDHLYLLKLDPLANQLTVTGYSFGDLSKAQREYAEAEKEVRDNPGRDAVLVSVDSLASLQRAYPNYFADTDIFLQLVDQAVEGRHRRVRIGAA